MGRLRRVVSADGEEVGNTALRQGPKDGGYLFGLQLSAGRPQRGAGGPGDSRPGRFGLPAQVQEVLAQNAFQSVNGPIQLAELPVLHRLPDHAGEALVDDGCGTARLHDEGIASARGGHGGVIVTDGLHWPYHRPGVPLA